MKLTIVHKRKLIWIIVVILMGFSHFGLAESTYEEFSSKEGGFTILMPEEPYFYVRIMDIKDRRIDTNNYSSVLENDVKFVVSYGDIPEGAYFRNRGNGLLDWIVSEYDAKASDKAWKEEKKFSLGSHPGKELRIKELKETIFLRMFVADHRLYQWSVIVPRRANISPEEIANFLDSFKLLGLKPGNSQSSQATFTSNKPEHKEKARGAEYKEYLKEEPSTCPLVPASDSEATPLSKFAIGTMFWLGILIGVVICVGFVIFMYSLLPFSKRIRTCPAVEFLQAKQIIIPGSDKDMVITPDLPEFKSIINNFTDEEIISNPNGVTNTIYIKIRNKRYAIQTSTVGWNFLGEEKSSRRLRNGMELELLINSAVEKLKKK